MSLAAWWFFKHRPTTFLQIRLLVFPFSRLLLSQSFSFLESIGNHFKLVDLVGKLINILMEFLAVLGLFINKVPVIVDQVATSGQLPL